MNEQISIWYQAIAGSLETMLNQFALFIPSILAATVILLLGVIFAKLIRAAVRMLLNKLGVEKLSKSTGIKEQLAKIDGDLTLSGFISVIIYWVVLLVFIIAATDTLGLPQIRQSLDQLIGYLPKVIAATLILLLGLALANLSKRVIYNAAKGAGFEFAKPVASAIYGMMIVLIASLVIGELEIETELLNTLVAIFLGAIAIAGAISLGLGSRSASEKALYALYIADNVQAGDRVRLQNGDEAVVENISTLVTRLRLDAGDRILIDNREFLNNLIVLKK